LEKEKPIFIQFLQAVTCPGERPKGILMPPEKKTGQQLFPLFLDIRNNIPIPEDSRPRKTIGSSAGVEDSSSKCTTWAKSRSGTSRGPYIEIFA
jgi:hypothetical protein